MKKLFLSLLMLPALTIAHTYQVKTPVVTQDAKHVVLGTSLGGNWDIIIRVNDRSYSVTSANINTIVKHHKQEFIEDVLARGDQFLSKHYTPGELNVLKETIQKTVALVPELAEELRPFVLKYAQDIRQRLTLWQNLLAVFGGNYKQSAFAEFSHAITQCVRKNYTEEELKTLYILAVKVMLLAPEIQKELVQFVLTKGQATRLASDVLLKFLEENFTNEEVIALLVSAQKASALIPAFKEALMPLVAKYRGDLIQKLQQGMRFAESTLKEYKEKILTDMTVIMMEFALKNYTEEEIDFIASSAMKAMMLVPELKDAVGSLVVKYCAKAGCAVMVKPRAQMSGTPGVKKQQQPVRVKLNKFF